MATLYIALEIGIALGSFASAAIYGNNTAGFRPAFLTGMALALVAFAVLWADYRRNTVEQIV
jgi:predicted MFS family arabinose efflux permease